MKRKKIVKKEVSEFNTSSMSKPRKILYNKIIKNYRFCEIYDFLKFIYINEVNFSDIFMRDLFYFLIKIERYTSEIIYRSQSNDLSKKYDINLINVEISLRYMINKILEAVIAKKYSLPVFALEKLIFASFIIFLKKSSFYCRFRYPYRLNKCIEDKSINGYINAINSRNNSFEFIFNLIKNQLKVEAEILDNNKRLLRVLNNKKLL
ncbi:hypothetical protein N5T95_09805 [Aliarcobacter cryaerophilus]|uniref:hypothetical protein n=1 Tax=Aliarcobacter cryaerophilus TaxID=28198 RepID=UPI0021B5B968|nr:hypothetical protein [Aliarcobacter cryaerophilus]MCT7535812.1 hypothetical protein [Aliarcobacter cryaerophilus]